MSEWFRDLLTPVGITILAIFAAVGWLLGNTIFAIIDRDPPIEYIEARAVEQSVVAGQPITILFDVDRKRICRVLSVYRYIVDHRGTQYSVATYEIARTRPGRERYDRSITVPENVVPGEASYFIRLQYGCNWYQVLVSPLIVESPRVRFMVLRPAEKARP